MSLIRTSIVLAGALLILNCAGAQEFKEFSSEKGKFKVKMPGSPKLRTQKTKIGNQLYMYELTKGDGAYFVGYSDVASKNEPDKIVQQRLDGAVQGMVANVKGSMLQTSKRITLAGGYPGRDVVVDVPDKQAICLARIFLVNGRLYQLLVAGPRSWVRSSESEKFFSSFALGK